MSGEKETLQSMADLLRSGAKMTDLACPACSSPIFKLKNNELWCAKCQKKVVIVKEEGEVSEAAGQLPLSSLETTLLAKIKEVSERMQKEEDAEKMLKLSEVLSNLLENLEKARKIKAQR